MINEEIPERLLPLAAVRVDIGDQPAGSGFFAGPSHVVTCAHVLEQASPSSSRPRSPIRVIDANGRTQEPVGEPVIVTDADLALLKLNTGNLDLKVALLAGDYKTGDELLAFGFPAGKPDGEPATFDTEGLTGGPLPWIKFKGGQVKHGMSGSALLNMRTGAVCAVLKRTRDPYSALGGYGIPVNTLFARMDKVNIRGINSQAYRSDRHWFDILSLDQKRALSSAPAGMVDDATVEFIIVVSQHGDDWLVSAVKYASAGGRGSETPDVDVSSGVRVDLNVVRSEVTRLFRSWKTDGRLDEAEQARLLGRVLYSAVLPGPIRKDFEQRAFGEKRRVDISLHFASGTDSDIVHLPWEQLYVQEHSSPLSSHTRMSLSRVMNTRPEDFGVTTKDTLSLLLLRAPKPPKGDNAKQVDDLIGRVCMDIKELKLGDAFRVDFWPELSPEDIGTHLLSSQMDVLHYVGYGRFQGARDEVAICREAAEDEMRYFSSDEQVRHLSTDSFADILANQPPRVVVLVSRE